MSISPEGESGETPSTSGARFEIALVVVLLAVLVPGVLQLAKVWESVNYASHGFLVPFVALWAASAHRVELSSLEAKPVAGGFLLTGFMTLCYLAALEFRNPSLLGLVMVVLIVAVVLALRGAAWARILRFPLGFLLFAVPLPIEWVTPVIVRLQLLVSSVGVGLLQYGGIAIYRDGNVLTLPGDQSLFVAEACSGITSLITLLPIGAFIAYFTEARLLRRLVIVAAVVPIALAGNLLRVLLTVLVSIRFGVEFATEGPLHEWSGVATYVIGCFCLVGVGKGLRRFFPDQALSSAG